MIGRWRQFGALTGLTALEAIRQPICLLLSATCIILIGLMPVLLLHQFGEDGRLVRDSALALHLVFGLFITGHAACSTLAREIRAGTASAVLSKPVSRDLFFLAKFAGIAGVVLLFSLCATAATLLAERATDHFLQTPAWTGWVRDAHVGRLLLAAPFVAFLAAAAINYFLRRPFESTAFGLLVVAVLGAFLAAGFLDRWGRVVRFDPDVDWRILSASVLVTLALLLLLAIALALSVRWSTLPTLAMLLMLLMAGLISDYAFGPSAGDSPVSFVLYRLLPNWQHFWRPEALANGGVIPWSTVAGTALYGAVYAAGVLVLGMVEFRRVEMK